MTYFEEQHAIAAIDNEFFVIDENTETKQRFAWYILDSESTLLQVWEFFVAVANMYAITVVPFLMIF